jgi:sugar (pentulose or hexulose) kinase
MPMIGWMGVDVGTSSTKAVVYTATGRPVGQGRATTPWRTGRDGVDADPVELLESALAAMAAAVDKAPQELVVGGIGVTGMGETGVLVDGRGVPVAPAIAWHDSRDGAEAAQLAEAIDAAVFRRRTGKPLSGQYALTKHRWLRAHVPSSRAAVRRFNVAEWVARGLGADEACERTLACRTGWLDLVREGWDDELLAWSGATASLMPPLVEAGTALGTVREGVHPRLAGAVVTIAGHDHQAAAVGAGATEAGDVLDSSGTSEALIRTVAAGLVPAQVDALAVAGITTDLSVRRGCWSLLGGTEGGLAMRRVLGMLGVAWADLPALDEAALAIPADVVDGVRIEGVGTAAVSISGVRDGVGPGHVWRATVDAATRDAVQRHCAMEEIVGPHERMVAVGGWCASAVVMDAKRRLFGPLTVSAVVEAGACGAATMAARAAGQLGRDDTLHE